MNRVLESLDPKVFKNRVFKGTYLNTVITCGKIIAFKTLNYKIFDIEYTPGVDI